jgi:hypothetical protein
MRARAEPGEPGDAGAMVPDAPMAPIAETAPDDAAANIVRLADVTPLANLEGGPGDERRVVAAPDAVYVVNTAADRVDRIVDGGSQVVLAQGQTVGDELVAELRDLFWLPGEGEGSSGRVAALDSADRLWSIEAGVVRAVPLPAEPFWRSAVRGAGYEGSLYVMDRGAGQIWRYRPVGLTFPTTGTGRFAEPLDLTDATDLAIDGAIYVMRRDGVILKHEGGAPADFRVSGVPDGLASTAALFTSPTAGRLLVADRSHGRVVVLSPEGAYQAQILRPRQPEASEPPIAAGRFTELHDVWWDERAGRLYIVAGSTLFAATYP